MSCGCDSNYTQPIVYPAISICDPCNTSTGCPIQLDFDCVIYHKDNNQVTSLTNLGLTNGATLNQFAEAVDPYIGQIKVSSYTLPCLRATHTINSLKELAEAVDTELCNIKGNITDLQTAINLPITPVDTSSINLTVSGTNDHTLQADVKISATVGNRLQILSDGVNSAPQVLSVDYSTKELTIVGGNTVALSALFTPVSGFLGNVSSDPVSPINGQYWYNTTSSQLKIRVNSLTKIITIS